MILIFARANNTLSCPKEKIIYWISCKILWENVNQLFGQPQIYYTNDKLVWIQENRWTIKIDYKHRW